jgi:hypothetical protein
VSGYVIRCVACTGMSTLGGPDVRGRLLRSWDVDAHDGRGTAEWTDDPARAFVFPNGADALEAWRARSKVRPNRAHDGKPNRPLTYFSVEVLRLDELDQHPPFGTAG